MKKTEIYYFTGTGNSLAVARKLAGQLRGDLISIASVVGREMIEPNADVIGITFPVYYANLPNIVRRFAEKLGDTDGKYVFAVCTYGGAAGDSLGTLTNIMRSGGKTLSAGFGVHMPQNAFRKRWEKKERVYEQAARRIDFIVRSVEARREGLFYANVPLQLIMTPFQGWLRRMTALYLEETSNTPAGSGLAIEQLILLSDRSFSASETCTGCGICSRICPVHNIQIVDQKPVWQNRCENCLACFNACPTNAISGTIIKSGYRYRHPSAS